MDLNSLRLLYGAESASERNVVTFCHRLHKFDIFIYLFIYPSHFADILKYRL